MGDTPELLRTKEAGKIASDNEYKKELAEVNSTFKGYQTMDAAAHPVVVKGKKAADLVSDKLYKAEYEDEKALIYYPVHISEGYEQVKKCKEQVADANYKAGLEDNKKGNAFKFSDTETYAVMKEHEFTKDRLYKEDYEKTKTENHPLAESNEMILSKELKPTQSKKLYASAAQIEMRSSNKLTTGCVEIAHAQAAQPLQSATVYKDDYNKNVKGEGRSDPANAFPEHAHIRQVGQTVAGFAYKKDAKKDLESVAGGPIDTPELLRTKEAGVIRSDIEYKKE